MTGNFNANSSFENEPRFLLILLNRIGRVNRFSNIVWVRKKGIKPSQLSFQESVFVGYFSFHLLWFSLASSALTVVSMVYRSSTTSFLSFHCTNRNAFLTM
jgi:hypothetical protein